MNRETIKTGQFYRILTNKTSRLWDRISLWTASTDVERWNSSTDSSKGQTVEEALVNIESNVTTIKSQIGDTKFVICTESEYDSMTHDATTLYFIKES